MLKVNEVYGPVVQGEGKSIGMECLFLRLSLCNLHCVWCDTPYTWNWIGSNFIHPEKYERSKEVHEMTTEKVLSLVRAIRVRSIVISGGEPFLQQKDLATLLQELKDYWIEVETNGTIAYRQEFIDLVNQVNCSPKLSNSGDPVKLRERPNTLYQLASNKKVNFKFVIATEQDAAEALKLIETYSMKEVYFMPQGKTIEELQKTSDLVQKLASLYEVHFTPRLHVLEFNGRRGV